jgi:L-galactose dehydrogenase/L-glyceraldehyde 3-phosphate reductase
MRKTYLGRTGLEISEIALGGGVTGGILIDADETTRVMALRRAVAGGINWIDTAPLYGNGASEETIGRHLDALEPRPHISTKVRIEPDDFKDIPGAIERSIEKSLKRLCVDRVALLQLHNQLGEASGGRPALTPAQVLDRNGVADTFERLKAHDVCRAIGITAVGDNDACLEVIESGRFDSAQVYYNALNPSAAWSRASKMWKGQSFAGLIAACFRQHMGTLAIRVWAGGPLASAIRPQRLAVLTAGTDLDNEMRCAAAVHRALADESGTPAQKALRFVMGNRDLSTRVIGIADLAFLDKALAAAPMGPLPPAAIGKLERLWASDFKVY